MNWSAAGITPGARATRAAEKKPAPSARDRKRAGDFRMQRAPEYPCDPLRGFAVAIGRGAVRHGPVGALILKQQGCLADDAFLAGADQPRDAGFDRLRP